MWSFWSFDMAIKLFDWNWTKLGMWFYETFQTQIYITISTFTSFCRYYVSNGCQNHAFHHGNSTRSPIVALLSNTLAFQCQSQEVVCASPPTHVMGTVHSSIWYFFLSNLESFDLKKSKETYHFCERLYLWIKTLPMG